MQTISSPPRLIRNAGTAGNRKKKGRFLMQLLDWSIVGALLLILTVTLIVSQRQVRSTADFLAANRCA